MKERKKRIYEERFPEKMKYSISKWTVWATVLNAISSVGLAVISVCLAVPCVRMRFLSGNWFLLILAVLFASGIAGIILYIINIIIAKKYERKYNYYAESKRVSTALLTTLKRTNFEKTCSILQSTYSNMPDSHPINYCQNVLVFDMHQHIRNICIRLKEMIVDLAPDELNDDMVTVDIVFSYLSDNQFNKQIQDHGCISQKNEQKDDDTTNGKTKWKIITSGDHTSSNVNLHRYIEDTGSFYTYLEGQGYYFCNDKSCLEEKNHYIWSSKDREYNRIGSIVGTTIELKNDDPEIVFVRAYLTITTYGRKLVEEGDLLDEEHFEKMFKETVINSYKTVIESEFAQMFIRHGIKEHFIDRFTGKLELK